MTQEQSQSITDIETEALAMELYEHWNKTFYAIAGKCKSGKQIYEVGGIALSHLAYCYIAGSTDTTNKYDDILSQIITATKFLLDDSNNQGELHKLLN